MVASVRSRRLRSSSGFVAYLAFCGVGTALLCAPMLGCGGEEESDEQQAVQQQAPATETPWREADGEAVVPDFDPRVSLAPMLDAVGPAVVSIRAFGVEKLAQGRRHGTGSGFVLQADGLVLTNHHVVHGASKIEVHLVDGRSFEAEILGSDPPTDLALLQVQNATELPTVVLGSSGGLRVGDWVVAMGSPMGLAHSATVGIVSAKGRGSLGLYRDSYLDFLQTDADIAPGSSGGPLFNLKGEVIAITTAVGAARGPGFAIPVDQAKQIVPQLKSHGKVARGWLGISGRNLDDIVGARIDQVYEGTPAHTAGLRAGDVVVKFADQPVQNFDDLRGRVAMSPPDKAVALEVQRSDGTETVEVQLQTRPDAEGLDALRRDRVAVAPEPPEPRKRRGFKLPFGSNSFKSDAKLGIDARPSAAGLEVVNVLPRSLAADLELQAGDVIESINGVEVRDAGDVERALGSSSRVRVVYRRSGTKHSVTLDRS